MNKWIHIHPCCARIILLHHPAVVTVMTQWLICVATYVLCIGATSHYRRITRTDASSTVKHANRWGNPLSVWRCAQRLASSAARPKNGVEVFSLQVKPRLAMNGLSVRNKTINWPTNQSLVIRHWLHELSTDNSNFIRSFVHSFIHSWLSDRLLTSPSSSTCSGARTRAMMPRQST